MPKADLPDREQDLGALLRGLTDDVCAPAERWGSRSWWLGLLGSKVVLAGYVLAWFAVQTVGLRLSGVGNRSPWGTYIVNFVFWVGVGHAGTLISAVLLLFRQRWRTAVARAAETMTVVAVACAAVFPLMHTGRPWLAILFVFPYPNLRGPLWINFRSPLTWDVFAVGTYATVSCLFLYVGMIPDLATLRDRAVHPLRRRLYGLAALGWRGGARQWARHESACLLLAGLSTPLVVSVHSIVSFDFAVSLVPGWHSTLFPPYFVAGAILSGLAMVILLLVPLREALGLRERITIDHLEKLNRILLLAASLVGLSYGLEFLAASLSGSSFETAVFADRIRGPARWLWRAMVIGNVVVPQLLWFPRVRRSLPGMLAVAASAGIGMWLERLVIVSSLTRSFVDIQSGSFAPTAWDAFLLVGSFGQFLALFLLFCRFLPICGLADMKATLPQVRERMREVRDDG